MLLDKYDNEKGPGGAAAPGAPKPGQAQGQGPQTPKRGAPGASASPVPVPGQGQPAGMVRGQPPAGATGARIGGGPAHIQPIQPLPSGMRGQAQVQPPLPPQHAASAPGFPRPPLAPTMAAPLQRTWLDRMADAVLGADPSSAALGPEQKYALICSQCKRHNGLAAREEFDEVQYICPSCGTFNTRRPSSVPVSSPWATPSRAQHPQAPVSPAPAQRGAGAAAAAGRLHPGSAAGLRRDEEEEDVGNDSAPPASPLGAAGSSSDDDEEEDLEEEEHLISGAGAGRKAGASGLSRRTRSGAGDDIDVDEDL